VFGAGLDGLLVVAGVAVIVKHLLTLRSGAVQAA